MIMLHPNDHALDKRAVYMHATREYANDPSLSESEFRRAYRAHKRAVRLYQSLAMRRRNLTIGGQPINPARAS